MLNLVFRLRNKENNENRKLVIVHKDSDSFWRGVIGNINNIPFYRNPTIYIYRSGYYIQVL